MLVPSRRRTPAVKSHSASRLLALAMMLLATPAFAENWPQWRGPENDGISKEKNLPAKFGPDDKVVWKLEMPGMGSSTPCVWGDKIFLTSQDGTDLVLMCVSTEGKVLWKKVMGTGVNVVRG